MKPFFRFIRTHLLGVKMTFYSRIILYVCIYLFTFDETLLMTCVIVCEICAGLDKREERMKSIAKKLGVEEDDA